MHTKSTVIKPHKAKEKEKNLTSSQKENANHWQRKDNGTEADSRPVTEAEDGATVSPKFYQEKTVMENQVLSKTAFQEHGWRKGF